LSRRTLFGLGGAAVAVTGVGLMLPRLLVTDRPVTPAGREVAATDQGRRRSGRVVTHELHAASADLDLGGRRLRTWAFGESLPGAAIRVSAGDELRVRLTNDLPVPTTVHWHGLALRNDMDGVPGMTMPEVSPGGEFDYAFTVAQPGTYWFHPHVGVQLDTGLYAPLIVDDPDEPGDYDDEAVLVLDDWTDGWGDSPVRLLEAARRNGMGGGMGSMPGMESMGMPTAEQPLGSDTGDVRYPAHLVNGRLPAAPHTITSTRGRRIRLRLINAGSDTAYRFAVAGHRLTVTHTDGFPVQPTAVDTLIIGMGERYDLTVTAGDGVFPIVAVPEGKKDPAAVAILRTSSGSPVSTDVRPAELTRQRLDYSDLISLPSTALGAADPDRRLEMTLTMADGGRRWLINGRSYGDHEPLPVTAGERVRLVIRNQSMMFHPMHLHGHTFALSRPDGRGIRKDTINVLPMQELTVDLNADNPGQWLAHCHNAYHAELGMMTTLSYRA
jgi:FtsP/CotA-like multicopper oxidase with cupredoxin domain